MWTYFAWSILLIGVLSFVYYNSPAKYWIPGSLGLLVITSTGFSTTAIIVLWIIWLVLATFILLSPLRVRYVTKFFLHWFRKQQPSLSQSEIDVLQAGGTWWEAEIFTGHPNWSSMIHSEVPVLTKEEQTFIDNQVETLCQMLNDWQIQQDNDMPPEVWDYIKKEGFWALAIEKKYGGHEFSAIAHSTIVSKIASRSISAAISIMVPNSLGPAEFIAQFGTTEQKKYYLPRLATGKEIGCFALTAIEAGSDATAIVDKGIVCMGNYRGEHVLGVRLNWEKRYITLAPIATIIALAFKLYDPEHLLGQNEEVGITVGLIPTDLPGVTQGTRHAPLDMAFLNGPIRGKDVFIPMELIPGGPTKCGEGWKMMMECLSIGRGISLPALATGATKLCFRMSGAYAQIRQQFKRSIGQFEGIAESLAHIGGYTYLCEASRLLTAQAVAKGARPAIASAITKYHLTEMNRRAVNRAMDIHAGRGIQMGPRNYLGRIYQSLPIGITVEGANILTRNLIIYGQGVMRCHPFLSAELKAAAHLTDKVQNKNFDRLFLSHIGFFSSRLLRALVYGVTGGRWIHVKEKSRTTKYLRQMTRMSNAFVMVTEVTLLIMGSKLKFKESLSARLGDIMSYLYLGAAVTKFYSDNGKRAGEWPFAAWALRYCMDRIQISFDDFFANFPNRLLARLMRWVIFPWGRAYGPPRDKLSAEVANAMQRDSDVRDRLTQYCYIGGANESAGRIEETFRHFERVSPLLHKLQQEQKILRKQHTLDERVAVAFETGILSMEEQEQLQQFLQLYRDALQVDEFE